MQKVDMSTEDRNPSTVDIDLMDTTEALRAVNREDRQVAVAVEAAIPQIAKAVDAIVERVGQGGRLYYVGAGTAGRIGVLDALDLPPVFGADPELVQPILAGGTDAAHDLREADEDDPQKGAADIRRRTFSATDVVIGLTPTGASLYTLGALRFASRRGTMTIAITCNADTEAAKVADLAIEIDTGTEVVAGSTRMKACSAIKMVLNMVSTMVMVRQGHCYGNLPIHTQPANRRLTKRVALTISQALDLPLQEAKALAAEADGDAGVAILMRKVGCDADGARRMLEESGTVRKALGEA